LKKFANVGCAIFRLAATALFAGLLPPSFAHAEISAGTGKNILSRAGVNIRKKVNEDDMRVEKAEAEFEVKAERSKAREERLEMIRYQALPDKLRLGKLMEGDHDTVDFQYQLAYAHMSGINGEQKNIKFAFDLFWELYNAVNIYANKNGIAPYAVSAPGTEIRRYSVTAAYFLSQFYTGFYPEISGAYEKNKVDYWTRKALEQGPRSFSNPHWCLNLNSGSIFQYLRWGRLPTMGAKGNQSAIGEPKKAEQDQSQEAADQAHSRAGMDALSSKYGLAVAYWTGPGGINRSNDGRETVGSALKNFLEIYEAADTYADKIGLPPTAGDISNPRFFAGQAAGLMATTYLEDKKYKDCGLALVWFRKADTEGALYQDAVVSLNSGEGGCP
jgi:hypothetical protein